LTLPEQLGGRGDVRCSLSWLGTRMWGTPLPPPVRFCAKAASQGSASEGPVQRTTTLIY
jgi:hypothetical protein